MKRYRQVISFLAPFRRTLILAILLTGSLTLIGMMPPLLMRRLINDVAKQGNWGIFPLLITLLFAVPILRAAVNVGNALALRHMSLGIIARTRKAMFAHLMRLSMSFYSKTPVGNITQRLMGDVANISNVASGGLIMLVTDVIAVAFALIVMFRLNLTLTVITLSLLPLYYLNYRLFAKRIQQNTSVVRSHMDHISSSLQERLSAHELIQAYGQERAQSVQFSSQAKQIMDAAIKGSAYNISYNQLTAFINKIGNTAIYCAGCYFFVQEKMEYGDVVAFCAYATQLLGPVVRFVNVANQIVQVGVSVDRIQEIMGEEPAINELPDAVDITDMKGRIEVKGLTFGYGDDPMLHDIHLTIPAGTHIAVAGSAGAGRTTLAMLLRRFYDPEAGEVLVDGRDIRTYRLPQYRRRVALALAESAILDGTIRDNLCYGNPDAGEERMIDVSKALGLHDFVVGLKDGYDARLGTGGLRLSAGARQQIGIGRALLANPAIFIADEATASLDPDTAEAINATICRAMDKRTCILIVHRLLMAEGLDQVVVMSGGEIVETGQHEELLQQPDALYRELFAKQYGEDRLPAVTG